MIRTAQDCGKQISRISTRLPTALLCESLVHCWLANSGREHTRAASFWTCDFLSHGERGENGTDAVSSRPLCKRTRARSSRVGAHGAIRLLSSFFLLSPRSLLAGKPQGSSRVVSMYTHEQLASGPVIFSVTGKQGRMGLLPCRPLCQRTRARSSSDEPEWVHMAPFVCCSPPLFSSHSNCMPAEK
jgi:hypothetical protein